ncbi:MULTISPECIES: DUF3006 domain-containing protein [Planococcus]|uniref:DUF3006 domain-containing protein n=1 Tax=Planococcus TaxID=1372 RepID=UPI001FED98A0|nr:MULTISPECIES: DUF3006 domain-containing protein [Planococcus]MCJ1907745.1 DUF3006 domain-containing protein [Planococcus ruber]GKW45866.1 hypothetical protein NCCP2050_15580 [Planococcus sp. NCCP-2050]
MKSNRYTIDRFDGDFAVLLSKEDETQQKLIERSKVENYANEGDIIDVQWNSDGSFKKASVLKLETERRKLEVENLIEKLKRK